MVDPCVVTIGDPLARAGALLADAIATVCAQRGFIRLAIPGGSALGAVRAARPLVRDSIWARLRLTWVDERCVALDDARSNRGRAYREDVVRPAEIENEIPLYRDGETPAAAVARVEQAIDAELGGSLDVALLGMGEDGHIASLFPGRTHTGRVAHVRAAATPPEDRITLTRTFLDTARTKVLVAFGESKRTALERLVRGDPALPAVGLSNLHVITDLDIGGA